MHKMQKSNTIFCTTDFMKYSMLFFPEVKTKITEHKNYTVTGKIKDLKNKLDAGVQTAVERFSKMKGF